MFFKEVCQMCRFSGRKHISTQCFHLVLFTCMCVCVCLCFKAVRRGHIGPKISVVLFFEGGLFCVRGVVFCLFWCWKRLLFLFVLLRLFYPRFYL